MLLYGKVCRRRKELYRTREQAAPNWRALCQARAHFHKIFGAELEELESYARDLRYTITRLRGRPLRRYKFWMRVLSSRFALGRSLACYRLMLALLIVSSCYADPPLWAPGSNTSFDTFVTVAGRSTAACCWRIGWLPVSPAWRCRYFILCGERNCRGSTGARSGAGENLPPLIRIG